MSEKCQQLTCCIILCHLYTNAFTLRRLYFNRMKTICYFRNTTVGLPVIINLLCVVCHLYFSGCSDGSVGVSCGWVVCVQLSIRGAHDLKITQTETIKTCHAIPRTELDLFTSVCDIRKSQFTV